MRNVQAGNVAYACDGDSLLQELLTVNCPERKKNEAREVETGAQRDLITTIESQIIPRLLLSHGVSELQHPASDSATIRFDQTDLANFAQLAMGSSGMDTLNFVNDLLVRGANKSTIILDLMAPAARLMGELWSADECSFVDVTLGLSRLQGILRELHASDEISASERVPCRVLLVPAPGEQHTFGLRVVEEFFRREGCSVQADLTAKLDVAISLISSDWFDVVGLSVSGEVLLPDLVRAIPMLRAASLNSEIKVLAGGVLFGLKPDLKNCLGADGCCADPREAMVLINSWSGHASALEARLN